MSAKNVGDLSLEPAQREQSGTRGQVDQQVDVARGGVFATGDAAEHPDVRCPMTTGGGQDRCPALPQTPPEGRVGQPGPDLWVGLEPEDQTVTGRGNQPFERAQCRLTATRLVGTDHALCDVGPSGHVRLRE